MKYINQSWRQCATPSDVRLIFNQMLPEKSRVLHLRVFLQDKRGQFQSFV